MSTLAVDPAGAFAVMEVDAAPGAGVVAHRHEREDLTVILIGGTLVVTVAGAVTMPVEGVPLHLPRGVPHALAAGAAGARLLLICRPAGLERVLAAVADPRADPDDRAALLAGHGVHAVGGRW